MNGAPDQKPLELCDGCTKPFASVAQGGGRLGAADNAVDDRDRTEVVDLASGSPDRSAA